MSHASKKPTKCGLKINFMMAELTALAESFAHRDSASEVDLALLLFPLAL